MIDPNPPEGGNTNLTELKFPATGLKFRLAANWLRINYPKTDMIGLIHKPIQMKELDFAVVTVLDIGPDCKFVKVGDRVLVSIKGIINQQNGVIVDGTVQFFTQENLVVTVVESSISANPVSADPVKELASEEGPH